MNGLELLNDNFSKKMGISLGGMIALVKMGAAPWMVMAVAIASIIMQGILDFNKEKQNEKSNSTNGVESADSVPASPG